MESFGAFDQVHVLSLDYSEVVSVWLSSQKRTTGGGMWLKLSKSWEPDLDVFQLESLAQVLHPFAQSLATHGRFDSDFRGWIYAILGNPNRGRPMVGVFMLLLCCGEFVSLQEQCEIRRPRPTKAQLKGKRNDAPGRVTRATNRLRRRIDLPESEPVREGIGRFVAVRKLSNHPVAVHRWVEN